MITPKNSLKIQFKQAFLEAFPVLKAHALTVEITPSTQAKFGHYQCNSAMKLSKILGLPPREIASGVLECMNKLNNLNQENNNIALLEIAGPGFINIHLAVPYLSQFCNAMRQDIKTGMMIEKPQTIVIDFPSVNAAKEMHVGHLRSAIIGDSLARLFEFLGNAVLRLNHIGDWGTSFGMLIAYIKEYDPEVLSGKKRADLSLLVAAYKAAKIAFDSDPNFKKRAQLEVVELQREEPAALQAWQTICAISRVAHQEIYDLLDVNVIERGESFYNPYLAPLIQDLENKALIELSDGAKCLFLTGFVNREGDPLPFMLQKSDGGYNYSTTDLAAIRHRIEQEKADRIIYVVDAGQSSHFAMLFAAAQKAGYLDPSLVSVAHVGFGVVLGADGKKFKTRSGETEKLIDLLTVAVEKAQAILQDRGKDNLESKNIARVLGINAVKYADLVCNRVSDYEFSYERMLRFEGNTAAFLMYSYVRIQGIKRKIEGAGQSIVLKDIDLQHPSEIALGLHLSQFGETIQAITEDLTPHYLCDYLYQLAEKFNGFFRDCRVEGSPEQAARLSLCELSAEVLKTGMQILGLRIIDKM